MAGMKRKKVSGPDEFLVKTLTALDGFRIVEVINEIYNHVEIPVDLSHSIFMALPKESGANKHELHKTNPFDESENGTNN